ncbi:tail fiber domain-containing protein [Herpetosiphon gulosus]|uniref:Peptidase S74 domain-containing protein n=1 Tax=Herpetosiphon gulosus TaxID=1973496 RepID=A0ABP9X0I3_9CHLR
MIRKRYLLLIALVLASTWLVPAAAQDQTNQQPSAVLAPSGEIITYQGMLRESGSLANGVFDFQFGLYAESTGGTALGLVTRNDVSVSNGLFTSELTFSEGLFNGESRWIELAVKADASSTYTTLTPRQQVTAAPLALALPGFWTRQNSFSPNLIGGYEGNTASSLAIGITINGGGNSGGLNSAYDNYSSIGGGAGNIVGSNDGSPSNDVYSTIGGGINNTASQEYIVIGGGQTNNVSGAWSTIGGGINNVINNSRYSVIAGGGGTTGNTIYDDYGTIAGGSENIAGLTGEAVSQMYATVGGGRANIASDNYTIVSGGRSNTASDDYSTVAGGYNNSAAAQYATISGGGSSNSAQANRIYDDYGTIGGGTNNAAGVTGDTTGQQYATVSGGSGNTASEDAATVSGGSGNSATANFTTVAGGTGNAASGDTSSIGGGQLNAASGNYSVIAGGRGNTASALISGVGGGQSNQATNSGAYVGGGQTNTATGQYAVVAGGVNNDATNTYTAVVGGLNNQAAGAGTFVGGGQNNNANSTLSAILGGSGNTTLGDYSIAAGENAVAAHAGSFVWAGQQTQKADSISTTAPGQFIVRAPGGAWFGSSTKVDMPDGAILATESGAFLSKGGTWANSSDKNLKSNFAAIDPQAVLDQLASIPVQAWSYNSEGAAVRHIGPTAQDFYAAFGLGTDDRHIATVDADGVALAGVQGLYNLATKQAQLLDQQAEQMAALDARLAALEHGQNPQNSLPWLWLIAITAAALGLGWMLGRRSKGQRA